MHVALSNRGTILEQWIMPKLWRRNIFSGKRGIVYVLWGRNIFCYKCCDRLHELSHQFKFDRRKLCLYLQHRFCYTE